MKLENFYGSKQGVPILGLALFRLTWSNIGWILGVGSSQIGLKFDLSI